MQKTFSRLRACVMALTGAVLFTHFTTAEELRLLWQLAPNDLPFLTTGNTERGVAYNPTTGNVLVAHRSNPPAIYILNGQTGEEIGVLNMGDGVVAGSSPGGFAINMIGVTEDGVIYAGNLTINGAASPYKLYRWESETAEAPVLVYEGDPTEGGTTQRWGDSMDVRGTSENPQVLIGSRAGSVAALITSTNGVDHTVTIISNAHASGAIGVAFGAGNTLWSKLNGQPLRHVSFDPVTGAGTFLRDYALGNLIAPIGVNAASNWLAGINIVRPTGIDDLMLFDISNLTTGPVLIDQEPFPGDVDNANYVGSVDSHGDLLVALDTNNGLMMFQVIPSVNPPTFAAQPGNLNILEGGYAALSATVSGTAPFTFQWTFGETNVDSGTNSTLRLTNVTSLQAGEYRLIASNSAGSATSSVATVTITPSLLTSRATVLWSLSPGDRPYLGTGNLERGVAYNKVTGRVLVVSRSGGVNVHVLDGATGEDLWTLNVDPTIIDPAESNPGGFRLNMIGVADDGVVYAANLDITGARYKIYRWENDSTNAVPTIAYNDGLAGHRYGDTFDVRGAGVNTEILTGYNETGATQNEPPAIFTVFTTEDGENFLPNTVTVSEAPSGSTRLGVAFGEGDTIWTKAPAQPLRHISYDLTTLEGTVLHTFTNVPLNTSAIAVQSNLVATIALETPDNVRLYDVSDVAQDAVLLDQDFFPTDNPNANGSASVDFGPDRIYALDTNNGLLALKLNPAGGGSAPATLTNAAFTGQDFTFTLAGTPNAEYRIEATTDFITWTPVRTVLVGGGGNVLVGFTPAPTESRRFYRAVAL